MSRLILFALSTTKVVDKQIEELMTAVEDDEGNAKSSISHGVAFYIKHNYNYMVNNI